MLGRNVFFVILFWWLVPAAVQAALFAPNAEVAILDARGVNAAKTSGKYSLVLYFADWCGHCQRFAPEFSLAATALRGIVDVGACSDEAVIGREGISGYPTVRLYRPDGSFETYSGPRSAEALVEYVTGQITMAAKRGLAPMGGGVSSGARPISQPVAPGRVIALNRGNFDQLVTNSRGEIWFVKFFAPWCGHCKAMAPAWSQLAREVPANIRIGEVDATVETDLAARYGVQSYPTLKVFHPNGTVLPYSGSRDTASLKSFVLAHAPPPRALHMRDDQQFRDLCENYTCLVAFLPHILDSSAAERKRYIVDLNSVAKAVHSEGTATNYRYFWVQAGDNYELEEQLRLGFGWPALVAFRKDRFTVHRGAFTPDATLSFIRTLAAAPWQMLPADLKAWARMPPWDGKDASRELLTENDSSNDEDEAEVKGADSEEGSKTASGDDSRGDNGSNRAEQRGDDAQRERSLGTSDVLSKKTDRREEDHHTKDREQKEHEALTKSQRDGGENSKRPRNDEL